MVPAFLCFAPTFTSVRTASNLECAVTELRQQESFAVVVPKAFQQSSWLSAHLFPGDYDVRDIVLSREEIASFSKASGLSSKTEWLHLLFPPVVRKLRLSSEIAKALIALAKSHADITNAPKVLGRIAVVRGTPCTRLHVDKVRLRTICSMYGRGSVLAPSEFVDSRRLFHDREVKDPNLSPQEHDKLVLRNPNQLVRLNPGDVAFMCGAGAGAGAGTTNRAITTACVHRSPRIDSRQRRLVLQIDDFS